MAITLIYFGRPNSLYGHKDRRLLVPFVAQSSEDLNIRSSFDVLRSS